MYKNNIKRLLDFTIALIGLICLSPIFIIVTIGLYFTNQGKPFFFQERPGLYERIFKIIKFKTMTDKKDVNGKLLPDADRLTPIGAFVRKTSLDEIPQLINVLKGTIVPVKNVDTLKKTMKKMAEDKEYYNKLKINARPMIQSRYEQSVVWNALLEEYNSLIKLSNKQII